MYKPDKNVVFWESFILGLGFALLYGQLDKDFSKITLKLTQYLFILFLKPLNV